MIPVFEDLQEWEQFKNIALSWIGTPYRHLQAAKGKGADCTLFVGSCLVEAGYMTGLTYKYYSRDWHIHTDQDFVLESAHRNFSENMAEGYAVTRMDAQTKWKRGDMVAFQTPGSRVTNHAGMLWDDGRLINAMNRRGVCFVELTETWARRATTVFRFNRKEGAE